MVGEVRDRETADMAIQAALTGHLVLSTLHTNDAPSALTRLVDMGVPPFFVAATVLGSRRSAWRDGCARTARPRPTILAKRCCAPGSRN